MLFKIIDCHKGIYFKIRFLGNTFVLISAFKNVVAKFIGGRSIGTRSYVITHCVSNIYSFAILCGIIITRVI